MVQRELLKKYDAAVKTVKLHCGPRPLGKSDDWLRGQDIGIKQGLKIARTILEELTCSSKEE